MKIDSTIILGLVSVLFSMGCSKNSSFCEFVVEQNPLELEKRITGEIKEGKTKRISEMAAEDALVVVNGYPLTKRFYDDVMVLKAKGLSRQKDANSLVVDKMLEQFKRTYLKTFVSQRLMIDNAFQLGVVTTNDVARHLSESLAKQAKASGKSVEKVLKAYGDDGRRYVLYEMAAAYVMNRLVSAKIPPKSEINDQVVSAFQKAVEDENAAAQATNGLYKARLANLKKQILAKTLDFGKVANQLSQDVDSMCDVGKDGEWGEFEEGEMDDPRIAAAVFALKQGEISDVLEDENGFHLVKVLKILPPEKNESGRIVRRERRKLAQIYIEKVPLLIRQDDVEMAKDLKNQMLMQAINEYIANLMTNGTNKVVYPHGRALSE